MAPAHGAGQRHVLAFIAWLGFFNLYTMRVSINIAIVAMVDRTDLTSPDPDWNATSWVGSECDNPVSRVQRSDSALRRGEFAWSHTTQELVLSSFYYGYVALQIPSGWLAERIGAKHLFGWSVLGCSFFALLVPVAARQAVELLIGVIVIQGLFQGLAFPSMNVLWSKWAPAQERGKLVTFSFSGGMIGTVVAMPIAGLLCDVEFDGGWPTVFYVFGAIGALWSALWFFLAFESPSVNPRITPAEREYIESTLPIRSTNQEPFLSLPWRRFLTSPPFIAIMTVQFCLNWGFTTLLTNLPTYMKEVQGFDIKQNGLLTAFPYLTHWLMIILAGFAVDLLKTKRLLTTINIRKLANAIGFMPSAAFLVAAGHTGCNSWAAVALFIASVGINGVTAAGYQSNHLDIAPKYAGTLMGIANSVGNAAGILSPLVVAAVVRGKHDSDGWRTVFYIAAAVNFLGTVVYTALAEDCIQKWASATDPQQAADKLQHRQLVQRPRSDSSSSTVSLSTARVI